MPSKVWSLRRLADRGKGFWEAASRDQIALRAAQASFFLITSAVPFLSLLLSLTGALLPENTDPMIEELLKKLPLSEETGAAIRYLAGELGDTPGVPLLSVSAATTLWSASRGISAVREGLRTVFRPTAGGNPVAGRLKTVFATLAAVVAAASLLLSLNNAVFGALLRFPPWAGPLLSAAALTGAAALIYRAAGGRGTWPGALFAAVGWMAFEAVHPLNLGRLGAGSDASVLYGAFAGVTLLMLRLYFRVIFLLLGAEVSRMTSHGKEANRSS